MAYRAGAQDRMQRWREPAEVKDEVSILSLIHCLYTKEQLNPAVCMCVCVCVERGEDAHSKDGFFIFMGLGFKYISNTKTAN